VVIAAERRGDTPEQLVEQAISLAGNQEAALTSVGFTELVHGIYRAKSERLRRQSFVEELRAGLTVYPYTAETALLAGRIDGEQTAKGVIIPFYGSADRRYGALARIFGDDGECTALQADPWAGCHFALKIRLACTTLSSYETPSNQGHAHRCPSSGMETITSIAGDHTRQVA